MYVNYFDRMEKLPDENPTIGVLLCADKNKTVVKFTLPESNKTIMASQYQLYLPSEKQLLKELKSELKHYKDNCSNYNIKSKKLSAENFLPPASKQKSLKAKTGNETGNKKNR